MTIRSLISILMLNLTLVACTAKQWDHPDVNPSKQQTPVVGGFEVSNENPEAAYVVMIYGEKSGESYVCTGTFISESLILTAAHCLSENKDVMSMFFGRKPFEGAAAELPIVSVVNFQKLVVQDGDSKDRHDIALIEFSGGLPEGAKIAQLPTVETDVDKVKYVLALGYGRTDGKQESGTPGQDIGTLREVLLDRENMSVNQNYFTLDQTNGRGVCFGDSGGPALSLSGDGKTVYVVGVASGVYGSYGGTNADECKDSGLYMRTRSYLHLIKEISKPQVTE